MESHIATGVHPEPAVRIVMSIFSTYLISCFHKAMPSHAQDVPVQQYYVEKC